MIPSSALPQPGDDTIEAILSGRFGDATGVDATNPEQTLEDTAASDIAANEQTTNGPDPVVLPDVYNSDNESLTDSYYKEHLDTHWGF